MITVFYAPEVSEYLNNLIDILYENDYFGHRESAKKYVVDLRNEIELSLPVLTPRLPRYRRKVYGKHTKFVIIRKNRHNILLYLFSSKSKQIHRYIHWQQPYRCQIFITYDFDFSTLTF